VAKFDKSPYILEACAKVINDLWDGFTLESLCQKHRLSVSTFLKYTKLTPELWADYEAATNCRDEVVLVKAYETISREADTNWLAAAWLLERIKPEKYGRNRQVTEQTNYTVTFKTIGKE
jgi:hypothetical protein